MVQCLPAWSLFCSSTFLPPATHFYRTPCAVLRRAYFSVCLVFRRFLSACDPTLRLSCPTFAASRRSDLFICRVFLSLSSATHYFTHPFAVPGRSLPFAFLSLERRRHSLRFQNRVFVSCQLCHASNVVPRRRVCMLCPIDTTLAFRTQFYVSGQFCCVFYSVLTLLA